MSRPVFAAALAVSLLSASVAAAVNTIVVDTYQDEFNGGGDCEDGDPATTCSLREAVVSVEGSEESNVIELEAGVYRVDITAVNPNLGTSGWMPVLLGEVGSLVIGGRGAAATVIEIGDLGIYSSLFQFITGSELTFSGLTFKRSPSVAGKSAVRQSVGRLILENCLFVDNERPSNGGAVESVDGSESLVIRGSVFLNNAAGQDGGAVYASVSGAVDIQDTVLVGNEASGEGGGAWLYSEGGPVVLRNAVVDGNRSGFSGGGLFMGGGEGIAAVLEQSTLSRNSALQGGGALIDAGPFLAMTNVTVSGNASVFQGAALKFDDGAVAELTHVTAARNRSLTQGFALAASDAVSLRYTLWANDGPECGGGEFPVSAGYNMSEDDSCQWVSEGDRQDVVDFFLGALADNGGPTQTHLLLSGSPALDAGPGVDEVSDQRGLGRPVDVDGDGVAAVDAGAVEMETEVCAGPCVPASSESPSGGCSLRP